MVIITTLPSFDNNIGRYLCLRPNLCDLHDLRRMSWIVSEQLVELEPDFRGVSFESGNWRCCEVLFLVL